MKKYTKISFFLLFVFISIFISGCTKENDYQYDYYEEDTTVVSDSTNYVLKAKVTLPKTEKLVPAVVMVHGSGPQDMDETTRELKLFKDLAIQLAKVGIASIRYDKRTYTYLEEFAANIYGTIKDEIIDDALGAVSIIKDYPEIDVNNIYILGHSLGGQLAPLLANKSNDVKGVVMLAGTYKHLIDVYMEQLLEYDKPTYDKIYPYYNFFRNAKTVGEGQENAYFIGAPLTYWVYYNKIDIIAETRVCARLKPMLLLQGGQDLQVKADTLKGYEDEIKDIAKSAEFKLYDDLNHMFVNGVGETIETAYTVKKDVPKYVIDDIYNFINKNK